MCQDDLTHLSYLIWFGVASVSLQVYPFADASLSEDMVTASYSLDEAHLQQESPKFIETDIGV